LLILANIGWPGRNISPTIRSHSGISQSPSFDSLLPEFDLMLPIRATISAEYHDWFAVAGLFK
jgi:hypothetical protein